MSQLIDLCGTPIRLDKIKDFRLIKRDCLFYPAYQETESQTFSLFARLGENEKKKFKFIKMLPYGALLNDKERPQNSGYEIKSFGEACTLNMLSGLEKAVDSMATLATDLLRIDTSGNKELRIRTQGGRTVCLKLRDIPAKVIFLSGKVSDVYKNDPIYAFLGEPIAPTIAPVSTLMVTTDKTTFVFFGGGIDMDDAEATYHKLFDAYKQFHEDIEAKKSNSKLPKLNLPKLDMPSLKLQSPLVIKKTEKAENAIHSSKQIED